MWIVPSKSMNVSALIDYDKQKHDEAKGYPISSNLANPANYDHEKLKQLFDICTDQADTRLKKKYIVGSINLAPDEFIDDQAMELAFKSYMKAINLEGFPYYLSIHTDTKHRHAHFIIARSNFGESHKEEGIFYKKVAKEISNKVNVAFGFDVIDNENLRIEQIDPNRSAQLKVNKFSFYNGLKKAITKNEIDLGTDLNEKIKKQKIPVEQLYNQIEEVMPIAQINLFLHRKGYFNSYHKKEVIDRLNIHYKAAKDYQEFMSKIKKENGLYARRITYTDKKGKAHPTIEYGLENNGSMIYFDQKSLGKRYHYTELQNLDKLKENNLSVLTFGQQRGSLKNFLYQAKKQSTSTEEFLERLKSDDRIHINIHMSGERINGYKLSLTEASNPVEFKASQIGRDLTISALNKHYESLETIEIDQINTISGNLTADQPSIGKLMGTAALSALSGVLDGLQSMSSYSPSVSQSDLLQEQEESEKNNKKRKRRKRKRNR